MQKLRSYYIILFFIFLSVFINSYVFFQEPFEFYFGYLIFIVLLPVFMSRYGMERDLLMIFTVLLLSGLFNIVLQNNTYGQFFKVFIGVCMSYLFYNYVIKEFKFDIDLLFKWYMKGCLIAAVIGLIQFISFQVGFDPGYNFRWIFNKWALVPGGNFGIRVNSIFAEPTHLGAVMSAAFFVCLYNLVQKQPKYLNHWQSVLVVVIYLLSFSGLGQIGVFLSLLFLILSYGFIRYVLVAVPATVLLFNFLYENVEDFRIRYDSSVNLYTTGEFQLGQTHGSSYILYNNAHVAFENFKQNFVFGTGLGSHPTAFEKYSLAKGIEVWGFNLNSADANSMFLRLVSETGLFGVSIFLWLMIKCHVRRNSSVDSPHWLISNAILVMILLNLFRQGHYFLNGFPLFVLMYYYNWQSYQQLLETGVDPYKKAEEEDTESQEEARLQESAGS